MSSFHTITRQRRLLYCVIDDTLLETMPAIDQALHASVHRRHETFYASFIASQETGSDLSSVCYQFIILPPILIQSQ